ncbi:MAG TPA: hypothetical protein VI391_04120 [Thermoanaerobaculia bacterium]
MRAGEVVAVRDEQDNPLLTYRSFASVVGVVGLVVSVIVAVTGAAAVLFLLFEGRPIPAIMALLLSAAFAVVIAMLVPPANVTLYNSDSPVLHIAQESNVSFPIVRFVVGTPEEPLVARLRKTAWSRLGRNRWDILDPHNRPIGSAIEESPSRALLRKVAGKFSRRYESNVRLRYLGKNVGWIIRRPNETGEIDVLDVTEDIDRRIAVALAALILGSEP